jgi:hypothetical protein
MISFLPLLVIFLYLLDYKATKNKAYLYAIPGFIIVMLILFVLLRKVGINVMPVVLLLFIIYVVNAKKRP